MAAQEEFQDFQRDLLNFDPDGDNLETDPDPNLEPIPVIDPEAPPSKDSDPSLTDNQALLVSKLDPIPVFTIADENGAPLIARQDDGGRVAGVFISQEDAEQFVVGLETSNPELASQVQVVPVSLADVYQLDLPEDDLEFAFVPEDEAVADASSSAVANGAEYEGGVPLFAARGGENNGYLTVERDGQQVIPFFFDLGEAQEFVSRFEEAQPELASTVSIESAPLEGVIETFETSDDEALAQIVLVPTEESREFLESNNDNSNNSNNANDSGDRNNVYRFFNEDTGVHFYTSSEVERDNIIDNLPNFSSEGVSYQVVDPLTGEANTSVVHRFLNQNTGVHVYTASETERSFIEESLPNYQYEGEVFAAYSSQVPGTIPVHRFYNTQADAHFYTPSEAERESVENNLPNYEYEGVAYYAYPADI